MTGHVDYKQIKVPLDEHQQLLLQRYIDAEKQEPDFIAKGLSKNFLHEAFFYFYYAGHGCSDNRQYIVLDEREVSKIFWPAEQRLKMVLGRIGSNCKLLAVFDCCREDYFGAKGRCIKAIEQIEAQQNNNPSSNIIK